MAKKISPRILHVLFYKEKVGRRRSSWIAQGIELDIAASGRNLKILKDNLLATVAEEIRYAEDRDKTLRQSVSRAPGRFAKRFKEFSDNKQVLDVSEYKLPLQIEYAIAA